MYSLKKAMDIGLVRDGDTVHFANLYPKTQQRKIEKDLYYLAFGNYDENTKREKKDYSPFGRIYRDGRKLIINTTVYAYGSEFDKSLLNYKEFVKTVGEPIVTTWSNYERDCTDYFFHFEIEINGDIQVDFVGEDEFPVLYLPKHTSYRMP